MYGFCGAFAGVQFLSVSRFVSAWFVHMRSLCGGRKSERGAFAGRILRRLTDRNRNGKIVA